MTKKAICCALALLPLVTFADNINLKPGLWETTTTTEIDGAPMPAMPSMSTMPPEMLANLPPEQRTRMEAMMANRGAGNAIVSRSCVTEKTLQRGFKPDTGSEQSCKVEAIKTTGTTQEAHIACTSARGNSTGVFKLTATSRESYDGTMDMNATIQNRPMKMKMKLKGKWLSANCGDVKPQDN